MSSPHPAPTRDLGARPGAWGAGAWALVVAVLLSWSLAALAVWAGVAPTAGPGPDATPLGPAADVTAQDGQVVLVGIPGLTWDLVDEQTTPTLTRMARGGGAAALVVRGTQEVTCAADAWLTVGAGQRAATDVAGCEDEAGDGAQAGGELTSGELVTTRGIDERAWGRWRATADRQALAPQLGTLAALAEEGGTCVVGHGPAAVLGAARPDGTVAVTTPADPDGIPPGVGSAVGRAHSAGTVCRIHLVSGPDVLEGDRSGRLPGADAALARLLQEVPEGTTVLVAGMGQTTGRARAQVLVASPVHVRDGAGASLSSGSTRQRGLVQLTDLTPTLLELAGIDVATSPTAEALAGDRVTTTPQVGEHVAQARDLALAVSTAKWQAPWVLGVLGAILLSLLGLARLLRPAAARRGIPLVSAVGTLAMATPVAAVLAGLVPWWRAGQPLPALVGVVLLGSALVTALAWAGPWRRHPLGPAGVVAAVTAVVLGVDVIWSARLGLISVLGLQPVTAGRFYGQGNVGFGIFLGAVLVLMGVVVAWLRGRPAALAALALGLGASVLDAAPKGGADLGGVPALAVATGLIVLASLGLRWTVRSLLAVALVAGLVAGLALVLDWARGPADRTHLGDFAQAVLDGQAWGVVTRKLDQSLGILVSYPVSWLAVLALLAVAAVVLLRPRWSAPLWSFPGMRSLALTSLVALVLAWVLNDSGIAAVGLALTMLIAAAITVLGRRQGPGREVSDLEFSAP